MIPIGVPMKTPMTVMMRLPTIGFSRPPALPGGGVISVKTAALRPLKPFQNSAPRMSASMARPSAVATSDSAIQTWLTLARLL